MSAELVVIIVLILVLLVVILRIRKVNERSVAYLRLEITDLELRRGADLRSYLDVILGNLGRVLVSKDRNKYASLVANISAEIDRIEELPVNARCKKLRHLCEKYPSFADFGYSEGWHHLQDCDANHTQFDELAKYYYDIRIFIALKGLTDQYWLGDYKISEDERAHLQHYIKQLEDTELLAALTEAEGLLSWVVREVKRKDYLHYDKYHYLTPDFGFRHADYHPATNDVLVWVRALGQYGVISESDGYTQFYRLDTEQDELVSLDPLFEATKTFEVSTIIRWDEH